MFGKKKSQQIVASRRDDVVVHTIPEMYYGGKNPEIYNSNSHQNNSSVHLKPKVVKKNDFKKNYTRLYIIVGLIIFLLICGLGWYYIGGYSSTQKDQGVLPKPPVIQQDTSIEDTEIKDEVVEQTSNNSVSSSIEVTSDILFTFPPLGLFDSADLDTDGISDMEESLYGSDSGIWDTDGDGYYDGLEVENLYSPVQSAPIKISTSGYVKNYIHPQFKYNFLYPSVWQVATVDVDGTQVLLSSATGEYIEIIRSEKKQNESFVQWYSRVIGSSARYTDFIFTQNRFSFDYYRRSDWLTAFFEAPDAIYTIIYHVGGGNQSIVYRRTMSMVVQSFVPFGAAAPLPEQEIIPTVVESNEIGSVQ